MFRAAKLNKVMVIGPSSEMQKTSRLLHEMSILHIDDFVDGAGGLNIGQPLEGCEDISKDLVKVRRTVSLLDIDGTLNITKTMSADEVLTFMQKDFPAVEKQALELGSKREKATSKLQDLSTLRNATLPLADFSKTTRFDIESLEAVAGYCRKDISSTLKRISPNLKIETVKDKKRLMLLIYYPKNVEKKLLDILDLAGFENIEIPTFRGTVADRIKKLDEETSVLEADIKKLGENIGKARTHSELKLLAAEEHLSNEVEKAELPLRCATTDHLFTIEGWVKKTDAPRLKEGIEKSLKGKVTVEILEKGEEDGERAPVMLKHSGPVKPFQYLVGLYSTPNLKEIDPTVIMALLFPIFFGLMIGDLAYGIILVIIGLIIKKRPIFGIGGNAVGNIIIIGGVAAAIFGAFVFGDMFGIPFHSHAHDPGEMTWLSLTGIDIPYQAMVGKLDSHSVVTLLVLSVTAGFFHMLLGLGFGLINTIKHREIKHALSRVGWVLVLVALYMLAMNLAQDTHLGHWLCEHLLFNLQANAIEMMGMVIPWMTIYMLVPGLILLIATEGGFAIIESLGMLTNLISYTRLAAVGVAKAALALAINVIAIDMLMPMGWLGVIAGFACMAVGQFFIVVLLGTLSAGIQALRLNYVEFFMKFYEGGGTPFKPFGAISRYTRRSGVLYGN